MLNWNQLSSYNSLNKIKNKNIKIYLIIGPENPVTYSNIVNRQEINDYFNYIVKEYELEGFFDFNKIVIDELDPINHFADPNHLNQIGVEKYNRKLIEILFYNSVNNQIKFGNIYSKAL